MEAMQKLVLLMIILVLALASTTEGYNAEPGHVNVDKDCESVDATGYTASVPDDVFTGCGEYISLSCENGLDSCKPDSIVNLQIVGHANCGDTLKIPQDAFNAIAEDGAEKINVNIN